MGRVGQWGGLQVHKSCWATWTKMRRKRMYDCGKSHGSLSLPAWKAKKDQLLQFAKCVRANTQETSAFICGCVYPGQRIYEGKSAWIFIWPFVVTHGDEKLMTGSKMCVWRIGWSFWQLCHWFLKQHPQEFIVFLICWTEAEWPCREITFACHPFQPNPAQHQNGKIWDITVTERPCRHQGS